MRPGINPTLLDQRATFAAKIETVTAGGGVSISWQDQFTVWAALAMPTLGQEQESLASGQIERKLSATLTVRETDQTSQIRESWRVSIPARKNAPALTWEIEKVALALFGGTIRLTITNVE